MSALSYPYTVFVGIFIVLKYCDSKLFIHVKPFTTKVLSICLSRTYLSYVCSCVCTSLFLYHFPFLSTYLVLIFYRSYVPSVLYSLLEENRKIHLSFETPHPSPDPRHPDRLSQRRVSGGSETVHHVS